LQDGQQQHPSSQDGKHDGCDPSPPALARIGAVGCLERRSIGGTDSGDQAQAVAAAFSEAVGVKKQPDSEGQAGYWEDDEDDDEARAQ